MMLTVCTALFMATVPLVACGTIKQNNAIEEAAEAPVPIGRMELQYATQYSVEYYSGGYVHVHVEDGNDYVCVPQGALDNRLGIENVTIIHLPCEQVYLAASSAMDYFQCLDGLFAITACSTKAEDYSSPLIQERIRDGGITYVGKYSAPDYEGLLAMNCGLAIESTMIYHSPKIKEELESLQIPVLVERSSYEEDPLGRLEWIKLYGVLLQKEEAANAFFDEQCRKVEALRQELCDKQAGTEPKKVAFFYIASNGYVNVRKPGDYLCKMIETAGGTYAFSDLYLEEENALSTVNINWEDFYKKAVDADILIYNGTIDGSVTSLEDLLNKNALFADYKAVQNKKVWVTDANLYQEGSKVADIIEDLYYVIGEDGESDTEFLHRLD